MYVSEIADPKRRGRPVVRGKERVRECMYEGGEDIELVRRECLDRERWRFFCRGHPLGRRFQRERGVIHYRLMKKKCSHRD